MKETLRQFFHSLCFGVLGNYLGTQNNKTTMKKMYPNNGGKTMQCLAHSLTKKTANKLSRNLSEFGGFRTGHKQTPLPSALGGASWDKMTWRPRAMEKTFEKLYKNVGKTVTGAQVPFGDSLWGCPDASEMPPRCPPDGARSGRALGSPLAEKKL